jgi:hypothetical protein
VGVQVFSQTVKRQPRPLLERDGSPSSTTHQNSGRIRIQNSGHPLFGYYFPQQTMDVQNFQTNNGCPEFCKISSKQSVGVQNSSVGFQNSRILPCRQRQAVLAGQFEIEQNSIKAGNREWVTAKLYFRGSIA